MQHTNTLTTGKVLPTLLKFAIPVLAAMFLQALYGGADLLIVGQFGTTSDVSGVSTGSMLLHTITNLIIGLTMGITVFVGQKIGEGKNQDAGKAIESCESQSYLGEWILKGIFQLKDYEPLTKEKLDEIGINGIRLYKTNINNDVHLEFIYIDKEQPPKDLLNL